MSGVAAQEDSVAELVELVKQAVVSLEATRETVAQVGAVMAAAVAETAVGHEEVEGMVAVVREVATQEEVALAAAAKEAVHAEAVAKEVARTVAAAKAMVSMAVAKAAVGREVVKRAGAKAVVAMVVAEPLEAREEVAVVEDPVEVRGRPLGSCRSKIVDAAGYRTQS
jgi:hypothetical protein